MKKIKWWRKSCRRLQPRSVLGSFGVVLMSCKVYFHVVRSALQNSITCWEIACVASFPFGFGAKKDRERDSRFWPREKWNESQKLRLGGGGGEGRKETSFLPNPLPALLLTPFFARPLTRSLFLNRTETLAMQGSWEMAENSTDSWDMYNNC